MSDRRIMVVVGSDSDLPQCAQGLAYLQELSGLSLVPDPMVLTMSIHRNTDDVLLFLRERHEKQDVDVLIVGAGWANHLTGTCDAYLRHTLRNNTIVVVGVAFEDQYSDIHTLAAKLSMTQVPGTQVVYKDDLCQIFVGGEGFSRACRFATDNPLPTITLADSRPTQCRRIQEVLNFIHQQKS